MGRQVVVEHPERQSALYLGTSLPPPLNAGLEWSFAWPGLGPADASPLGTSGGGNGAVGVDGVSCTGGAGGAVVTCGAVLVVGSALGECRSCYSQR